MVRLRPVWMTNHPPSVLWHCWLGHQTCKTSSPKWPNCVHWDVKPYLTEAAADRLVPTRECSLCLTVLWIMYSMVSDRSTGVICTCCSSSVGRQRLHHSRRRTWSWTLLSPVSELCVYVEACMSVLLRRLCEHNRCYSSSLDLQRLHHSRRRTWSWTVHRLRVMSVSELGICVEAWVSPIKVVTKLWWGPTSVRQQFWRSRGVVSACCFGLVISGSACTKLWVFLMFDGTVNCLSWQKLDGDPTVSFVVHAVLPLNHLYHSRQRT